MDWLNESLCCVNLLERCSSLCKFCCLLASEPVPACCESAVVLLLCCREASDIIKKGKMCSLFINDLDAGAGRMGAGTQYTVNNQMVNATLMNIADNPSNVQLPGVYKQETIPRVPIVCTGNRNVKQSCLLVILLAQNIDLSAVTAATCSCLQQAVLFGLHQKLICFACCIYFTIAVR